MFFFLLGGCFPGEYSNPLFLRRSRTIRGIHCTTKLERFTKEWDGSRLVHVDDGTKRSIGRALSAVIHLSAQKPIPTGHVGTKFSLVFGPWWLYCLISWGVVTRLKKSMITMFIHFGRVHRFAGRTHVIDPWYTCPRLCRCCPNFMCQELVWG